ncbi:MAG TPA: RDD family protein [Spirochaetota bacterium]|nr:RDD family protein [Spirochaetota bacterium]HQO22360.1 RDD family protein [Spirochaetota bacterium]HQQ23154.1 RDD family protein [Spirochaetota bacterium]
MTDSDKNYEIKLQNYSVRELTDIVQSINRNKYPERYKMVIERLSELESEKRLKKQKDNSSTEQEIEYAGFFHRLIANVIDMLIISIFFIPVFYLLKMNQNYLFGLMLVSFITLPIYFIYFHAKSGATPGKCFIGLKIVKLDLSNLKLKDAVLRSSGDILFSVLNLIWLVITIGYFIHKEEFTSEKLTYNDFIGIFGSLYFVAIRFLEKIWFWSEVAFVLTNAKKRAIHDYIAGTVVVVENTLPASSSIK